MFFKKIISVSCTVSRAFAKFRNFGIEYGQKTLYNIDNKTCGGKNARQTENVSKLVRP